MKTWASLAAAACIAAVLSATVVLAQAPPAAPQGAPQQGPPPPPTQGPANRPDRPFGKNGDGMGGIMEDKELREMVETVMMAKLATRLGLNDEQALQLVRQRSKTRDETQKLTKERRDKVKALENAAKADKPDDADVDAKLKDLVALDEKIASQRRRSFEESGKTLTAVQRAKLYMFFNEFENDMRQLINRARGGMAGGGPGGPGGPADMREGGPGQREGMQGMREQFRENMRKNLREGVQGMRQNRPGDEARPGPDRGPDHQEAPPAEKAPKLAPAAK